MKKNIRKIVTVLLTVALAAGVCTSCKTNNASNGKIKLSVGSWPSTEGSTLDTMNSNKEGFEKENPDVEIVPDTWKFTVDTFYVKAASKQLPNLYSTNFTEVAQIIENDYARDLTDAMDEAGIADKFNKQVLDVVKKDGKIHVRIDYKNSGVGSNSCGPALPEKYRLSEKTIEFGFSMRAVK